MFRNYNDTHSKKSLIKAKSFEDENNPQLPKYSLNKKENSLLAWCQQFLTPKGIIVNNFSSSWSNGHALFYLVQHFYPNSINMDMVDMDNKMKLFELSFDIAYNYGKVPKLINVEDIMKCVHPEPKSMQCYLMWFHKNHNQFTSTPRHNSVSNDI